MKKNNKKSYSAIRSAGPYLNLGFQFAVSIFLGMGGGYWVDKKLNTMPLFLILGLCIGAASGFLSIYHTVYPNCQSKKQNEKDEER